MGSVQAAIDSLSVFKLTPTDALSDLTSLEERFLVLDLFKHYFPRELKLALRKTGSLMAEENYKSLVMEFLRLMDQRLYPLGDFFMESLEMGEFEGLPYSVPFYAMGYEFWEMGLEEICELDRTILTALNWTPEIGPEIPVRVDFPTLQKLCTKQKGPLRHLCTAVEVVLHHTGNTFVDITDEELGYCENVEWSVKGIDLVRSCHKEALTYFRKCRELDEWARGSRERLAKISSIISSVAIKPEEKVSAPRPLVQVLGGVA